MAVRTAIPAVYVLVLGIAEHMAGPGWAGLMSTFPSMSLVVLVVTHLEAGPAEASRIAKVLPAGNTSTLAFLAAFRLASPGIGLAGGTIVGYAAALAALLVIEGIACARISAESSPTCVAVARRGGSVAFRGRSRRPPACAVVLRIDPRGS